MLDCPLSGTGAQAARKDLAVFASGDKDAYEKCIPVFKGFSRVIYYLGEFGNGSKMKYVANLLVAIHNVSAAEAFVLGMKGGLDPQMIYKVISDSAGNSRMFEVRGPLMVEEKYDEATMKVEICRRTCTSLAISPPNSACRFLYSPPPRSSTPRPWPRAEPNRTRPRFVRFWKPGQILKEISEKTLAEGSRIQWFKGKTLYDRS